MRKLSVLILILNVMSFGSVSLADSLNVDSLLVDLGSGARSKIIKLEAAKQRIQDTVSIYKKGMSKREKQQLTNDLKALRKCKFQKPCKEELTNRIIEF